MGLFYFWLSLKGDITNEQTKFIKHHQKRKNGDI